MEREYHHERLDKARALKSTRKQEHSQREEQHKKKKKHKDDRRSRSGSRHSHKKKRSRSRERSNDQRKHKKHIKNRESHSKERREDRRERRDDGMRDRDQRKDRDTRDRNRPEKQGRNREEPEGRRQDNRNYRGQFRQRQPRNYQREEGRQRGRDGRRREDRREEKDPYFEKRRQIELVRKTDTAKAQEMENQLEKIIILDQKEREIEQARQKFKEAQKEMQEAKRQDHTILVYCLPLKAKEKHIWTYFSQANCGKIRDIRIIKDARSHRSKGVAYVQFYSSDCVQKALQIGDRPFELKGRFFHGLKVQHSQAEKNRAAAAARQMRVIKPAQPLEQQQETIRRQTKVFVGGLVDKLAQITEKDLKELFEPFGQIEYVDIHRDPQTGICKGFAYIQYVDPEKAKLAVKKMNGIEMGSQKLVVNLINVQQRGDITASDEFIYNTGNRMRLMNQLSGATTGPSFSNLMRPSISTVNTPYLIMTNMFKMQGTSPAFFEDMRKQIQARAEEFGTVERIFIEKNNQGNIWIKFSDTASAVKCQDNLNNKFFDNKKIFMYFVTETTYQTRVGT